MTTRAPAQLAALARDIENVPDLPSAANSGIVGDLAHRKTGGYHISIEDQPADNYSVVRPGDKAPPGKWRRDQASAIDTSMSKPDMILTWGRVYAVWIDHSDPRRKYFNGFNGWNGIGEAERLDFVANTRKPSTPDHKWHNHDETPRRYADEPEMRRAKASVYRGESVAQYMLGTSGSVTGKGGQQVQMLVKGFGTTDAEKAKIYVCDGMFRREVSPAWWGGGSGPITNGQTHQSNFLGPLSNGGSVFVSGGDPDVWGIDIKTLSGLVSPEQMEQIANSVAAQVIAADTNDLSEEDLEGIRQAALAGTQEALGTAKVEVSWPGVTLP